MATQNYFAMDPAISRTVSNLTRALLGSASDDAAIARARYYDEQTKAQQLQSRGLEEQLDAQNKASLTPLLQNQVANVFGGEMNNGNLIQRVLPGGPQQSVPLLPNQNQMSQDDVTNQLGVLARSMYGDGTSNANQLSQMLGNLAESGQSRLAQSMILGGSDDQAARGALMLQGGNKYNNPGFAETELRTDDATARRGQDMEEATKLKVGMDKNQVTREVGMDKNQVTREVGMDENARRERWEKYKTDANAKVDRDKNEAADATARYKIDNEPVEINVTPGKMIILDPTTAERIGVEAVNDPDSKFNGLHILDGGPKPGEVVVKVGKEDVFMDEATAEALNIPQNDKGQYVLPGAGFKTKSGSGSGGGGFTIASGDNTQLTEVAAKAAKKAKITNIPEGVILLLVNQATSPSVMGNKKNMAKGTAHISAQLRKGYQEIVVPNTGTFGTNTGLPVVGNNTVRVPLFLTEQLKSRLSSEEKSLADMRAQPALRNQFVAKLIQVGYTDVQAAAIVDRME